MKPVVLRLRAFGSYAGELDVDFARLSLHGIFSITGPTGAGKSTIFDALVYALYGDLPGFRVDGNVRSQFSDVSTPTSVSLDFVVHGERWRVERRPAQPVRRARGKGAPIERPSTVVLGRVGGDGELVPGTGITKKEEVRRRIDELVGLTKAQFEQVVLIPQGRFEEVLKADTSTRAPLLRRLFPVEVFTRTTEGLKTIAAVRQGVFDDATRAQEAVVARLCEAYEAAVAQLPGDVRGELLGDAEVPAFDPSRIDGHAQELAEALRRVDELVVRLASASALARSRLEEARRAAADWDAWRADGTLAESFEAEASADAAEAAVLARARRLADLEGALDEWEAARRTLAAAEPELTALVDAIDGAWPSELYGSAWAGAWAVARADAHEAGVLAERLGAEARRLEEEARRFDRLVATTAALEARRGELDRRRVELGERAVKLDAEEQTVVLVADEVQRLRAEAASLEALTQAVAALEREHETASRRADAAVELARAESELAAAASRSAGAAARAQEMRAAWREGLAARLAELLEDGAPCPTCGALEHPVPARWNGDAVDDAVLAEVESARDAAAMVRDAAQKRAAGARGAIDALARTRPVEEVASDLAARRAALALVHGAADQLVAVTAEERRRRAALLDARATLGTDCRAFDAEVARLEAELAAHTGEVGAFVESEGEFGSPAPRAASRGALAAQVDRLCRVLRDVEEARGALRLADGLIQPVAAELGASDPSELRSWLLDPEEVDARSDDLAGRCSRREDVRRRIAAYESQEGFTPSAPRPDVELLVLAADAADGEHVAIVERRGMLAHRVGLLATGARELADGARAVDVARSALEQAKTVADRCAGLGGGPASLRLSLENWVLADYLRQVLSQANRRLDVMTGGRYALELTEGVTDGRKPWGLDLSVFDATTGQVRPATTLSGGETFMAALALALGLADIVSGGSNREVGALFVDEGFGSLDPQSLDAVIDVLRSLEDGGRIVGVISHVRELQQALPSGITVEPTARGSRAAVHYPPA